MDYEGQLQPTAIEKSEHIEVNGVPAKRTLMAGWDGTNIQDVNVDTSGNIITSGSMPIPEHDEMVLAYTDGNLTSVTYKKSSVTVATKTLTYTDGNLTKVVVA
jgi:hypothetical protein